MINTIKVVSVLAFAFTVFAPSVSAQNPQPNEVSTAGLTVSPAIFEVTGKPGQTVTKEFSIQNISSDPMPVSATLDRLRPYEQEIDLKASESFNASAWVKLDEPYHILKVKERRKITATISVPKNAEPGGHYATVVLQPLTPESSSNQNTAKIAPQVGLLVFITVPGDAKYDVKLQNQAGRIQLGSKVDIASQFVNTGTIHILPTPKVVIRGILGGIKKEIDLKPSVVLPNTIKNFDTSWNTGAILNVYSAETVATYGSDQAHITSGRHYFVMFRPLPLLLLAAIIYFGGKFVRRTHPRWRRAIRAFRDAGKKSK